jgi:hypothetical protein
MTSANAPQSGHGPMSAATTVHSKQRAQVAKNSGRAAGQTSKMFHGITGASLF